MAGGAPSAAAPTPDAPAPAPSPADPAGVLSAVLLLAVAGTGLAVQSRINGAFAVVAGAGATGALLAALASFAVGTAAVAAVTLASPAGRAALRPPRPERVRWWYLTGGLGGATVVTAAAVAVPLAGVALFSIGVVAGQTAGGLLVDRLGIGPGGRRPVTAARLAGAVLAVAAVALSAVGTRDGDGSPALLLLVTGAGVAVAVQAAVNGRLTAALGDARAASLASFVGGTAALGLLAGALVAATEPELTAPAAPLWTGGLAGAVYVTLAAAVVSRVGVLRLTLAVVAGQLLGSVLLDAAVPVEGQGLTAAAVAGTVLTFVAVVVAGRGRREAG